ncbi:MAG: PrsW family intramembrane metalloprotease [Deltaproteobacteria bacterium]|nr:PrsW family intramembrane metalloprotease [Deltaproteobacteria bacterium]
MALEKDIPALAGSLIPAILLLAFVYSQDRRRRHALRWVVLTFSAGMCSAAAAFFVFELLEVSPVYRPLIRGAPASDLAHAAFALGLVGPIEEFLKLLAVVVTAWRLDSRKVPSDGIRYGTAAALGFAAAENWYAMWATGGLDLGRAALVPFVHMLFAAFWGWGLGACLKGRGFWPLWTGLALASVYHGLFDYLEYMGGMWHFLTLPIVALMWVFMTTMLRRFVSEPQKPDSGPGCALP